MLVSPLPLFFLDIYIVCHCHFWDVMPYSWSLVFLLIVHLRIYPSICRFRFLWAFRLLLIRYFDCHVSFATFLYYRGVSTVMCHLPLFFTTVAFRRSCIICHFSLLPWRFDCHVSFATFLYYRGVSTVMCHLPLFFTTVAFRRSCVICHFSLLPWRFDGHVLFATFLYYRGVSTVMCHLPLFFTTVALLSLLLSFTPLEFFTSVLADGFSLEFEWQQVSLCLQDSPQYFGHS